MYRRNILIRIRLLIIQNTTTTYLNIQHSHFENFLIVFDKWSIALINYLLLIVKNIYITLNTYGMLRLVEENNAKNFVMRTWEVVERVVSHIS